MIPLQMIVLLSVVMMYTATEPATGPRLGAAGILVAIVAMFAFLMLLVWHRVKMNVADLHQSPTHTTRIAIGAEKLLQAVRWATIVITAVQLWATGWGPLVVASRERGGWDLARYPGLAEIVLLLPPMLAWLGCWALHYQVEKAIHERTMPYHLAGGLPMHEMPTRRQYVLMQARHQFFIAVPILGLNFVSQLIESSFPKMTTMMSLVLSTALIFIGLMLMPALMTWMWHTQPLTGPLRERLDQLARRHHLRYRNILVWRTHHFIQNAAVLGYLPFARYFLLSDALLESLSDQQIEAVFSHELGHVKHRHIWWYILLVMSCVGLSTGGSILAVWLSHHWWPAMSESSQEMVAMITESTLLLAFLAAVFSRISKQFEHQADWFAAQHMTQSILHDAQIPGVTPYYPPTLEQYAAGMNAAPDAPVAPPAALSSSEARALGHAAGAAVFASALSQIVSLANRSYTRGGWLHPSPYAREQLLMNLATHEKAVIDFDLKMFRIRLMIVMLFALSIAAVTGAARLT